MNQSVTDQHFMTKCQILRTNQLLITKIPSERYQINNISVIVFSAVLILPTIALNLVASITILKTPQLKSKPCYFIILVQSLIDLAVGSFWKPFRVLKKQSPEWNVNLNGHENCQPMKTLYTTRSKLQSLDIEVHSSEPKIYCLK